MAPVAISLARATAALKRTRPIPHFQRWINKKAVKQRDSRKRGQRHPNHADDFTRAVLCYLNNIRIDEWYSYRKRRHRAVDERFVVSSVQRRTYT